MSAQPEGFLPDTIQLAESEHSTILRGGSSAMVAQYEASKNLIVDGHDWRGAVADFLSQDCEPDHSQHDLFRGLTARLLEYSYKQTRAEDGGSIDNITLGMFNVLSRLRHVPEALTVTPGENSPHQLKRQPNFFESLQATTQRYRFMEQLPSMFDGIAEGIVVGGSMAYGPFYSVRDGERHRDASDVDALLILRDDFLGDNGWVKLLDSHYVSAKDKVSLLSRFATFSEMLEAGVIDIISQRFDVPGANFNMSAHLVTAEVFEQIIGTTFRTRLANGEDAVCAMRDYKPKPFEHTHCVQSTFDGSTYDYEVPEQTDFMGGKIALIPAYIIDNGTYYPGIYQNLVSPEFEAWHDPSNTVTPIIDQFRQGVLSYIHSQRQRGQHAQLELSHVRNAYFSPGRYSQRANLRLVPQP